MLEFDASLIRVGCSQRAKPPIVVVDNNCIDIHNWSTSIQSELGIRPVARNASYNGCFEPIARHGREMPKRAPLFRAKLSKLNSLDIHYA